MVESLFEVPFDRLLLILVSTVGIFATVITYTRIAGLRSFSKMSSFDFAMTVAVGSLVATVAVVRSPLIEGMTALAVLYLMQVTIALLRRFSLFKQAVDNKPLLLMSGSTILKDNMRKSRITEDDIRSKLRSANIRSMDSIRAVVLETTGDISVLHGSGKLDLSLLEDVRDSRRLGGGDAWPGRGTRRTERPRGRGPFPDRSVRGVARGRAERDVTIALRPRPSGLGPLPPGSSDL